MNREAVIVAACRTAVGKATKGTLARTRPEAMGVTVLQELVRRAGNLDPQLIDDVIIGCAFPESYQGMNMGRILVVAAGFPDRVPAMTVVNRFCSSGLETIAMGAHRIMVGAADVVIAGGVESMSEIPMGGNMMYPHPALVEARPSSYAGMGLTAENVAERYNISRDAQDAFALESHKRAGAALDGGKFDEQIVPIDVQVQKQSPDGKFSFETVTFQQDEGVRRDTTPELLAKLKPVFKAGGSVTAGNSSQTSDGAAGVLLMSRDKANELGLEPLATFRHYAVEGCEPEYMGMGPAVAIPKVLKMAGLEKDAIDLIELNEAFAAQSVACVNELGLASAKVNVNGGAIALGHPLGCTGSFLTNKLIYGEMRERKARFGIVSMCIGFGMGAAGIFEVE